MRNTAAYELLPPSDSLPGGENAADDIHEPDSGVAGDHDIRKVVSEWAIVCLLLQHLSRYVFR